MLTTGTTITVGLAGCTGSDDDSPESVVEQFWEAVNDGEFEEAASYVHPDDDEFSAEELEEEGDLFEEADITVEETELVEEDDDEAIVEATLSIEVEVMGEEQSETEVEEFLLETHDGDWLIAGDPEDGGSQQPAPQASLNLGCEDSTVVVSHRGGDTLVGSEITDNGDGSFSDDEFRAGDSETLIESPEGETEHILVHEPSESVIFQGEIDCS